jgi:hypothetical protein
MLAPLSMRCSWKRRTSSAVAVSGERLTVSVLLMESSILSEVNDASILRTGLSTDYVVISTSLASRNTAGSPLVLPRCGLERSDFVGRPEAVYRAARDNHPLCEGISAADKLA